ncbi:hypothetical protein GU926_03550 [Nibribacter ruber]|uniref:Uncharacterized protein n=1 Tax=Nibribacter ruber TaxID=2698458 RepID=A0A6P1NZW7_9BACT|nr:hypothetical protein [Nibribacter ruber]QHL86563.1 hypothetical protein GU926_03550 [Nibribacter ruber]
MKRLATILLLTVMLTQAFSKVFVVLEFEANREFITSFLCINRAKPQLQCHGKCYLQKKLKKADQDQSPASQKNQLQKAEITLFYQPFMTLPAPFSFPSELVFPAALVSEATPTFFAIFHPPKLTV